MKHELRPAIHIKKQLEWACRLGGAESLGISQADPDQIVLSRLMASQIWQQLASTLALLGVVRKGTMAFACPNARHFSLSQYATSDLQAATPALERQGSESE